MAASTGLHSHNTTLQYDLDDVGMYTIVAEVMSITGPGITRTDVEFTHLSSDNKFKEFKPGFGDPGEVEADLTFTQAQLNTFYNTIGDTIYWWKVVYPLLSGQTTGAQWKSQGYINDIGNEFPEDDRVGLSIKIKLTGKPTWANGS